MQQVLYYHLEKPSKKLFFFNDPATKALPPPLELSGHKKISRIFFRALKNGIFS